MSSFCCQSNTFYRNRQGWGGCCGCKVWFFTPDYIEWHLWYNPTEVSKIIFSQLHNCQIWVEDDTKRDTSSVWEIFSLQLSGLSYETGFRSMEGEMKENLGCFGPKNNTELSLWKKKEKTQTASWCDLSYWTRWYIIDGILCWKFFLTVSVTVARGKKTGHLRYSTMSVNVSLKDTLFSKFSVLNSGQLFNPPDWYGSQRSSGEKEWKLLWWEHMSLRLWRQYCETKSKLPKET